jgi:hypothetical protein
MKHLRIPPPIKERSIRRAPPAWTGRLPQRWQPAAASSVRVATPSRKQVLAAPPTVHGLLHFSLNLKILASEKELPLNVMSPAFFLPKPLL